MREALGGLQSSVGGLSVNEPFYPAMINYRNRDGVSFAVTDWIGNDNVARFDAHSRVSGQAERVSIQYDVPYIKGLPIKGLPTKVCVDGMNGHAVSREILCSFQATYTSNSIALYGCLMGGKEIKTSAEDPHQG